MARGQRVGAGGHGVGAELTGHRQPVLVDVDPGMGEARAWYDSPAYQEILPLRTRHIEGDCVLVPGVAPGYDASAAAAARRAAASRTAG